jgi:cytochrome c2
MVPTRWLAVILSALIPLSFAHAQEKRGDVEKGKEVFEQCAVCHNADSEEKKMGPGLKGLFKKGKLANGMPAYAEMLEKDEKDNLIAYLKTL